MCLWPSLQIFQVLFQSHIHASASLTDITVPSTEGSLIRYISFAFDHLMVWMLGACTTDILWPVFVHVIHCQTHSPYFVFCWEYYLDTILSCHFKFMKESMHVRDCRVFFLVSWLLLLFRLLKKMKFGEEDERSQETEKISVVPCGHGFSHKLKRIIQLYQCRSLLPHELYATHISRTYLLCLQVLLCGCAHKHWRFSWQPAPHQIVAATTGLSLSIYH